MKKFISFLLLFYTSVVWAQSYVPQQNDPRIKIKPAVAINTWAFDLKDVRLLDGPFRHAMQMDSAYLLVLNPDRLLYRFYKKCWSSCKRFGIWRLGKRGLVGSYDGALFVCVFDDVCVNRE